MSIPANHILLAALWVLVIALSFSQPLLAEGRLAIIVDDIGYNFPLGKRAADLNGEFTLAVLPFTPHGIELAQRAYLSGKEIMLHVPMSNHHNYPLGRGGLRSGMQRDEFLRVLRRNLASVPHIKGVNNHMGSQLTEESEPMRWLMEELKIKNLYFVDSRTSARTQALIMAEKIQLPSGKRDVFLDDDRSRTNIKYQLIRALKLAQQQGSAVAIGHPYPETLSELEQLGPLLEQYDVQLVKISQLVIVKPTLYRLKGGSNASCMAPPIDLWPRIWMPIDPFDVNSVF